MTADIETVPDHEPDAVEFAEPGRTEYRTSRLDTTQVSAHWPQIAATIQASVPEGFDKKAFVGPGTFQDLVNGVLHVWAVQAMRETPQIVMWVLSRWQSDVMTGGRFLSIDSLHAYETLPDDAMQSAFSTLMKFCRGGGGVHMIATTSSPRLIGLAQRFGGDVSMRLAVWSTREVAT